MIWLVVTLFTMNLGGRVHSALELAWTAVHYPAPSVHPKLCNNFDNPYLCDPDEVIDLYDKIYINEQLSRINSNTNCDCFNQKLCANETVHSGYTLGVGVVNRILNFTHGGNRDLLPHFAHTARINWNLGRCADDAFILLCQQCEMIIIDHGDLTKRKIPEKIRRKMEKTGTQLLTFTNHTIVLEYLLTNYYTLFMNRNETPSISMLKLPFQDMSSGVITVMILTSLLAVAWVTCVAYLLFQGICRQRLRQRARRNVGEINADMAKRVDDEANEYHQHTANNINRPNSFHIPDSPDMSAKGALLLKYMPVTRSPKQDHDGWRWRSQPTMAASAEPPESLNSNAQTVQTPLIEHVNGELVSPASPGAVSDGYTNDSQHHKRHYRKARRVVSFDSHSRHKPWNIISRVQSHRN